MKILIRISLIILVIMLPLAVMCLTDTLVWHNSNTYQYNLNDTQILDKQGISNTEDQVSGFFADYMSGNIDEFQLKEDKKENPEDLFSAEADKTMSNLRMLTNILLIVGAVSLMLVLAAYAVLLKKRQKEKIRKNFKWLLAVFGALFTLNILLKAIAPVRNFAYGWIFDYPFKDDDLLVTIMSDSMTKQFTIFECLISLVIMCVLWYISSQITKPNRIFFKK